MHRNRLLAALAVAALALGTGLAGPALAERSEKSKDNKGSSQESKEKGKDDKKGKADKKGERFTVTGIVREVDRDNRRLSIAVKGGQDDSKGKTMRFVVDRDADVKRDGEKSAFGKLAKGDRVSAKGYREANGPDRLMRIQASSGSRSKPTSRPSDQPTSRPSGRPTESAQATASASPTG